MVHTVKHELLKSTFDMLLKAQNAIIFTPHTSHASL